LTAELLTLVVARLRISKNGWENLYCILINIEINCANAFQMLSLVYGDVILSSIDFYRWYKTSEGEECREVRNDEKDAGRWTVSGVGKLEVINILIIKKYVVEDRWERADRF